MEAAKKADVKRAEEWMNNYPRKLLDWKTPRELFEDELKVLGMLA